METVPTDVLKYILFDLDVNILYFASLVCKRWQTVIFSKPKLRFFVYDIIVYCAKNKWLELLNWLNDRFPHRRFWQDHNNFLDTVACTGDLNLFYWTLAIGCLYSPSIYLHAAENGFFHLIQHALHFEIPFHEDTLVAAVKFGNLEMIQFFVSRGLHWNRNALNSAIQCNNWDLIIWLHETTNWYYNTSRGVACKGNLEFLQLMKEKRVRICQESAQLAARNGHLDVVKWLCENTDCYTHGIAEEALVGQHKNIFDWAVNYGFIEGNSCNYAVYYGLDMLKFTRSLGFSWSPVAYELAIKHGSMEIVQWLHDNGCPMFDMYSPASNISTTAAVLGKVLFLQYFHSVCEKDMFAEWERYFLIGTKAVEHGHVSVLEWIYKVSWPWISEEKIPVKEKTKEQWTEECSNLDRKTYVRPEYTWRDVWYWYKSPKKYAKLAAYYGQLEILKWLLATGCPWNSKIGAIAATQGHMNILVWAAENSYEWDRNKENYPDMLQVGKTVITLHKDPHVEIVQLMAQSMCPWDLTLSDKEIYREVVQFAQDSGCTWSGEFPIENKGVLDWLENKGWCPFNRETIQDIIDAETDQSDTESQSTYVEIDTYSDQELEFLEGLTFPDNDDDFNEEMIDEPYYIPTDCPMYE